MKLLKTCRNCKACLSVDSFCRDRSRPDGHDGICKSCKYEVRNEQRRARYRIDPSFRNAAVEAAASRRRDNPVASRDARLAWRRAQREQITDWYVRRLLANKTGGIQPRQIPQGLVDVKRQHLLLLRLINQKEQE